MKKKIFLGVLSLMAMTLAACGGSQPSQESQPESTPQSQSEPASQPESQPASEPESQPESQPASEPASEPESQSESEPASEESSQEESSEDTRTPTTEFSLTVGGEAIAVYEDEEYDGSDVWEGVRKFYADPFDVTAGQAIAAKNANDEEVWPNGFNDQNNVAGAALGEFTVIDSAEDALFTLYVYADGGAAFNLTGKAAPSGEDTGFAITVDGTPYDAENQIDPASNPNNDKAKFVVILSANEELQVKLDGVVVPFAGVNGVALEQQAEAYTATVDGTHTLYVTANDEIWLLYSTTPSEGAVDVNLYTKFAITDEQAELQAYVWFYSNETDGVWIPAEHVAESWTAESNRHFTFKAEAPVDKYVVLALFNADSGVTVDNPPENWDAVAIQSGDAKLNDWGTQVGADVYGKAA